MVARTVKNLPTMRGTQLGSLSWEDTLEREIMFSLMKAPFFFFFLTETGLLLLKNFLHQSDPSVLAVS